MLWSMDEIDFIELQHDVERLEGALTEDLKEIKALKADLREVLGLMRLLGAFFERPVFGTMPENPAEEFEKRLKAMLEKHGIEK
jgi:hypothetical protein